LAAVAILHSLIGDEMAKYSEDSLVFFTRPPSDSEATKLANAERMVKEAICDDDVLSKMEIQVFGQGSYANDTNVRRDSDIDINVRLMDIFFFDLPSGKERTDYGLNNPVSYTFSEYKNAVENALVNKFGRANVTRKDKCITVEANSYRVETDVVPTFDYRSYSSSGSYVEGAEFRSDSGNYIINFPLQHISNGKEKNSSTQKRFKRLTRIYRRIRYNMLDDGVYVSDNITSFLLECLVWNVPNNILNQTYTWTDRLKGSITHLYERTREIEKCKEWGEVSELLYLFHSGRKWTNRDVNNYLAQMWDYLEY
jgi:hypothetical protein